MSFLRNHPFLSILLIILLSLKFIIVPVFQWQETLIWDVFQSNKRLVKSQNAIEKIGENQTQKKLLESSDLSLASLFYPQQNEPDFKLAQQQWLEKLVSQHNLKLTNIGWLNSATLLDKPVTKHSLSLNVEGETFALPSFHLALMNNSQWLDITSFSLNLTGQNVNSLGRFKGTMEIVFYQLNTTEEPATDRSFFVQSNNDE